MINKFRSMIQKVANKMCCKRPCSCSKKPVLWANAFRDGGNSLPLMLRDYLKADPEKARKKFMIIAGIVVAFFILTVPQSLICTKLSSEAIARSHLDDIAIDSCANEEEMNMTSLQNGTFKFQIQVTFVNGTLTDERSNLTLIELFEQFPSSFKSIREGKQPPQKIRYHIDYGMLMSVVGFMISFYFFCKAKDLQQLLLLHLFAAYSALLCFYVALTIRDWSAGHYEDVMYDSASFSHFFLLTLVSWSSIISSRYFTLILAAMKATEQDTKINYKYVVFFFFGLLIVTCFLMTIVGLTFVINMGSSNLPFGWVIGEDPPPFINGNSVFMFSHFNWIFFAWVSKLDKMRDFCCPVCVRKRNSLFFNLSVMTYITWGVGVLESYLSLPLLRRIFIAVFFFEGLVFFFACKMSDSFKHNASHYDLPAPAAEKPDEPIPQPQLAAGTGAVQLETGSNGEK